MAFEQYEFAPQEAVSAPVQNSPLANLGAAMAPAAGSTGLQVLGQVGMEAISQRSYRKNQKMLYDLGQKAQKNAAKNAVEGMKAAGLSPAALAGQPQTAAVSSAPKSTANAAAPQASPEMNLLNSQAALIQSETKLNDAKREGQEIENFNKEGETMVANDAFDEVLALFENDFGDDPAAQAIVHSMRSNGRIVHSKAEFDAMLQVVGAFQASPAVMAERMAKQFETAVVQKQLDNPLIASAVAIKPLFENAETRARIAQLVAWAGELRSATQVNQGVVNKMKTEIEWLGSEIAKNYSQSAEFRAQANAIANSDVQTLIKNGDWYGVAANAIEGTLKLGAETGAEVVKARFGGVGYAAKVYSQNKSGSPGQSAASPASNAPAPSSGQTRASASRKSTPLSQKVGDDVDRAHFNRSLESMKAPGRVFTTINGHPYFKDPKDKNWRRASASNGFPIYK